MQTFVSDPDLSLCAAILSLSRPRLGRQRIECRQIDRALSLPPGSAGWQRHPNTLRWKGHRGWLCLYALAICAAWRELGYVDNQAPYFEQRLAVLPQSEHEPPPWWGGDIHHEHRILLCHKVGTAYIPEWLTEELSCQTSWQPSAPGLAQEQS